MSGESDVAPGEDSTWRFAKPARPQRPEGEVGEPSTAPGEVAGLPPEKEPVPGGPGTGPQPPEVTTRRVVGLKGGIILSQDSHVVRYRKKCLKCGYLDSSVATALIRYGVTRGDFYCPKCRKTQPVEVHGTG
jgi:hypothetical protein